MIGADNGRVISPTPALRPPNRWWAGAWHGIPAAGCGVRCSMSGHSCPAPACCTGHSDGASGVHCIWAISTLQACTLTFIRATIPATTDPQQVQVVLRLLRVAVPAPKIRRGRCGRLPVWQSLPRRHALAVLMAVWRRLRSNQALSPAAPRLVGSGPCRRPILQTAASAPDVPAVAALAAADLPEGTRAAVLAAVVTQGAVAATAKRAYSRGSGKRAGAASTANVRERVATEPSHPTASRV